MAVAFGFDPDPSSMHLDDLLDQRQAHPHAINLPIQLLEEVENPLVVVLLDPHTVVPDIQDPFIPLAAVASYPDLDARPGLVPVNLAALSIRFCRTCRSRGRSPKTTRRSWETE